MTPSPVKVGRATAPHRDDKSGRFDTARKKRNPFQTTFKKLCNKLHCVSYTIHLHSI